MSCRTLISGAAVLIVCEFSHQTVYEAEAKADREVWELESDERREHTLARAEVFGEAECPWPWYADRPYEVQEPEVIGGW